ncbi:MAG: methyltransferase domain-containing protein [bacterium]
MLPDMTVPLTIQQKCPLCGGVTYYAVATFPELTWVSCSCGLIYKRTEAEQSVAAAAYDETYFTESDRSSYNKRTRHRIRKSKVQILNLLEHVRPGPLLDVGCSLGYGLAAAGELGLEAVGLDISEFAVETCRKRGFKAEKGSIDQMPFADATFQMVVMKHVLEHTPEPGTVLREVRRILRPGGAVFISTPQAGYNRAVKNPARSRFYRPENAGRDHFIYYTPVTLSRLLKEEQLVPVRIHPHIILRHACAAERYGRMAILPFFAAAQALADLLALRKEFWLVAMKPE